MPELAELAPGEKRAGASLLGTDVIGLPTGVNLTPDAAPGARLAQLRPAGNAVATALSPDRRTLAVLTSGYNQTYDAEGDRVTRDSAEYVFLFDVSGGLPRADPTILRVPNTFGGIAFDPSGRSLYVSGGPDDVVHEFTAKAPGGPGPGEWEERLDPIPLGHLEKNGYGGRGPRVGPYAAGLALTASGDRLIVANHENDSVSVVDTRSRTKVGEVPLGATGGAAGGEFPRDVATLGDDRAWVTSQRDREIVLVDHRALAVRARVKVGGAPARVLANRAGTRLYVANANSDTVSIVDPARGTVVAEVPTAAPAGASAPASLLRGSNPNGLALSPDERTLYVTNGGNNTLALVSLEEAARVVALVPTGWYPHAVSAVGGFVYVANGKSNAGPNPHGPWGDAERAAVDPYAHPSGNQHVLQLETASLLAFPVPGREALGKLTLQALLNNRFAGESKVRGGGTGSWDRLRRAIRHVVYVIGENRTFDQVFGDLERTDHDPKLVHFGERITPNHHALARAFVALDRFFDAGGVSGDGWQWTVGGRSTDVAEKAIPVEYADRGEHGYDWEGSNRNVNVGLPTLAERLAANPETPNDPNLLPGTADVAAIDGPDVGGRGLL
jgi:YVTN family beta-propeller protein